MPFHEQRTRSLVKAATYRFISIVIDGVIVFVVTGRYDTTLWILVISNTTSAVIYFVHERFWNRVHWGRSKRQD